MQVVEIYEKDGKRVFAYVAICDRCKRSIDDLETSWGVWDEPQILPTFPYHSRIEYFHEDCLNDAIYFKSQKAKNMTWFGARIEDMKKEYVPTVKFDPCLCQEPVNHDTTAK